MRAGDATHLHADDVHFGEFAAGAAKLHQSFGVKAEAAVATRRRRERHGDEFLGFLVERAVFIASRVQLADAGQRIGRILAQFAQAARTPLVIVMENPS